MKSPQSFLQPPRLKFHVNLHDVWVKAGSPSHYSINKATGVSRATINEYTSYNEETGEKGTQLADLSNAYLVLCKYFQVNWRDHVEVVEEDADEGEVEARQHQIATLSEKKVVNL